MSAVTSAAVTLILYASSSLLLWRRLSLSFLVRYQIQLLAAAGAVAQGYNCFCLIHTDTGIDLNLMALTSLCAWALVVMLLLSSVRRPVDNLLLVVLPLAMLATAAANGVQMPAAILPSHSTAMLVHVILSILACSLLTAAALQALLLAYLDRALKRHQSSGRLVRALPPLQTMEHLLFEFLWGGLDSALDRPAQWLVLSAGYFRAPPCSQDAAGVAVLDACLPPC